MKFYTFEIIASPLPAIKAILYRIAFFIVANAPNTQRQPFGLFAQNAIAPLRRTFILNLPPDSSLLMQTFYMLKQLREIKYCLCMAIVLKYCQVKHYAD